MISMLEESLPMMFPSLPREQAIHPM